MSQMKEQDKSSEKQLNELEIRNENNDSEDDPGSQNKNGEDARRVYQRLRSSKEQTEMSNTLESINSRITEAEEQVNDLKDRMVKITAKQTIEKKNDKK